MNLDQILLVFSVVILCASAQLKRDIPNRIFDYERYDKVINFAECQKQVSYMKESNPMLLANFLDAGVRIPRGVFMLSITDLGNYHQCLAINDHVDDMHFQGKYCYISVPFNQSFHLPFLNEQLTDLGDRKIVGFRNNIISEVQTFAVPIDTDSLNPANPLLYSKFNLALCMPQVCSTQEWMRNVLFNLTAIGFRFDENFCRLPDDKPWIAVDYVAIGVFSALGFLSLISTLYDVNHVIIQKKDPKKAKVLLRTFSVYTNTRRLLTFSSNANALDCLDGIRAISMMWVIIGHTFSMYNFNANLTEAIKWLTSGDAVFISTGLFTVDSFFLMAGILLVYTSVGKLTGVQLLKRLHIFYFNRLLRMFPLLAALVLLEASAFHRVGDGPYWENMGRNVERCRKYWWTTLLHIQNYYNPDDICIQHSWYIAIDIQLHIVSPIVLFWVLGKSKTKAWTALISGLLSILVASSIWNFLKELPSTNMTIPRLDEQTYYMNNYYMNALCRGAPFFVGMIVGYILHIYKGKNIRLNVGFVLISWAIALCAIASAFYTSYVVMQLDWDNQIGDSLFNSYMRTVWSIGLSWVIFACVKGYGGPINWLLTLNVWKIPARVSFAMYLYHYPICFVIAGMQLAPTHFTMGARIYDFLAVFALAFMVSFLVTVVIDAPFSVLIKMLMEGGQRRPRRTQENGRSKPGQIEKNNTDLEKTVITTLDKSAPPLNKNFHYPEKSGPPLTFLEKNGPAIQRKESNLDKIEPISPINGYLEKNVILDNSQRPERSDPPLTFLEKNGPSLQRKESNVNKIEPTSPGNGFLEKNDNLENLQPEKNVPPITLLEKNAPALHRQESNLDKIEPISPNSSQFDKNVNVDTVLEKEKLDESPNYETSRF